MTTTPPRRSPLAGDERAHLNEQPGGAPTTMDDGRQLRAELLAARQLATAVAVAVLVLAVGIAMALPESAAAQSGPERVEEVMELEGDRERGRIVFTQAAGPSCGTCHVLAAVGARGRRGPSLDEAQPREVRVVRALVGDEIEIHERQGFSQELTNQQVADVAAFVSEATVDPVAQLDLYAALRESSWAGFALALSSLIAAASLLYIARILLELLRRSGHA